MHRDPVCLQHPLDRGLAADEGAVALVGQAGVAQQDLRGLVVADLEDPLHDLGERRRADRRDIVTAARAVVGSAVPTTVIPASARAAAEHGGRGQRRVGHPAVADRVAALVDPERRDRGDDVVGDVVGPPVGVLGRPAEERVVVAEAHLPDAVLGQRPRRLPGEGGDVGLRRRERRRGRRAPLRPAGCSAGTGHRRRPAPAAACRRRAPGRCGSRRRGRDRGGTGRPTTSPPWWSTPGSPGRPRSSRSRSRCCR